MGFFLPLFADAPVTFQMAESNACLCMRAVSFVSEGRRTVQIEMSIYDDDRCLHLDRNDSISV